MIRLVTTAPNEMGEILEPHEAAEPTLGQKPRDSKLSAAGGCD
jgi:hypothetical protein